MTNDSQNLQIQERPPLWQKFETCLFKATAFISAILLALVIVLLLSGVVSRYVLHAPLTWSDELGGILFLWLTTFGAALATYRFSHMRMTAVVSRLGSEWEPFFTAFAITATTLFFALILYPAIDFAMEEAFITTSALEISNAWRASALPVGFGLALIFGLGKMAEVIRQPKAIL
ncbi:TRAP transporter small permease, partial [Alcaligenes faecalis]